MFDWLFGKKKEKQVPVQKKEKKEQDNRWKYDLLVQFLCSPEWRVTVLNFVDQNCIVFDNEEENKFAYTQIHNKFKELVAGLFDSVMHQIGIDPGELVELVAKGIQSKNKKIFEQLLICDDFLKFKQIMVKRNKVLQKEASDALQSQQIPKTESTRSNQLIQKPSNLVKSSQQTQEEILRRNLQNQKIQEDRKIAELKEREYNQKVQAAQKASDAQRLIQQQKIAMMKNQEDRINKLRLQENQRRRKQQQQKQRQEVERLKLEEQKKKLVSASKQLPAIKKKERASFKTPLQEPTKENILPAAPAEIPEPQHDQKKQQAVQDRKKRLLEQRQILKKKKMQERQKEIDNKNKADNKVQTIVLGQNGINDRNQSTEPPEEKVSQEEIERRRNLMKRIKNKIIEDI